MMRKLALWTCAALISVAAFADLSPEHRAWGQGPVKWIMTPAEAKAWKSVDTDEKATRFIDLFWARRDPSEGTAVNEFRSEFEGRVIYADQHFGEKNTRGALTERGRFYVILGPPSNLDQAGVSTGKQSGVAEGSGTESFLGSVQMGARQEWRWEGKDAQKYGMPKIYALFVEDPVLRTTRRSPQYGDVMAASPVALKQQLVRPDLKEVPEWAAHGGLRPVVLRTRENAQAEGLTIVREVNANDILLGAPPAIPADAMGVTRFTLVKNVYDMVTESTNDPFEGLAPVGRFTKQDELGWVARYCANGDPAPLKVSLKITGMVGNEKVNMTAPADEVSPDRLRAMPGCSMIRGSVPLADVDPGTYDIVVTIEDAASKTYTLTQSFVVE